MIDTTTSPVKYQGDPSLGAWFGDEELKNATVAKMRKHREMDQIVQGVYQTTDPERAEAYRGCLVGCTLPKIAPEVEGIMEDWVFDNRHKLGLGSGEGSWHYLAEFHYGIPAFVFSILDDAFEDSYKDAAPYFAVEALEAIPVGARYESAEEVEDAYFKQGRQALLAYLAYEGHA